MKLLKRIRVAWWAAKNSDQLTMLHRELLTESRERNSRGGVPNSAYCAKEYLDRYLYNLPIN